MIIELRVVCDMCTLDLEAELNFTNNTIEVKPCTWCKENEETEMEVLDE